MPTVFHGVPRQHSATDGLGINSGCWPTVWTLLVSGGVPELALKAPKAAVPVRVGRRAGRRLSGAIRGIIKRANLLDWPRRMFTMRAVQTTAATPHTLVLYQARTCQPLYRCAACMFRG